MKLSEALRKGIQKKPKQGFGMAFPDLESSCVVGAVIDGYGFAVLDESKKFYVPAPFIDEKIPDLYRGAEPNETTYWSLLIKMNDHEKKTREEIANWLEAHGE